MEQNPQLQQNKNKVSISLNLKFVVIILLIVIAAMFALWRPWSEKTNNDNRTVQVTGKATLKAEPDEYVFSPSYTFINASKDAALSELSKKSDTIVAELKKLGVSDSKIKTNADGYERGIYFPSTEVGKATYSLSLTITVGSKDLAQKVQDYLVTTAPQGLVTPYSNFSDSKRKQLESQARDAAEKDAKAKAEQSAKNIGYKLGKVKTISEGSGFGGIMPMYENGASSAKDSTTLSAPSLSVQPGENDLSYQISVTYYIK